MTNPSIAKQASFSILIVGLGLVTSIIRIVFLTRTLDISDYGTLSVLLTTMMVLSYLFPLGSFQYIYKESSSGRLTLTALKSVLTGTGIISILWILAGTVLALLLSSNNIFEFGLLEWELTLVASGLSAILFVLVNYLYGQRQVVFYNIMLFLRGYAWVYILILLVLLFNIRLTVMLVVASWIALITIALIQSIRRVGFARLLEANIDMKQFQRSIMYSTPLLPSLLSIWGVLAISKYILIFTENSSQVALFSIGYTLFEMVYLIAVSISQTFSPYVFADWKEKEKNSFYFDVSMKCSILLATILTIAVLFLGKPTIQLLAGSAYTDAGSLIPLMAPLSLLRVLSANIQQRLMATDQTRQMGIIYIISLFFHLVVGAWFGQLWGLYGVIASLLISHLILLVMIVWKVQSEIKLASTFFSFHRMLINIVTLIISTWLSIALSMPWPAMLILAIAVPIAYLAILYAVNAISRKEVMYVRLGLIQFAGQMCKSIRLYRK